MRYKQQREGRGEKEERGGGREGRGERGEGKERKGGERRDKRAHLLESDGKGKKEGGKRIREGREDARRRRVLPLRRGGVSAAAQRRTAARLRDVGTPF